MCTGNICRSPVAEVVFANLVNELGLTQRFVVSSAGTGDWHVGQPADPRALRSLAHAGYDGSTHRARQFDPDWFDQLDLVIALDASHDRMLRAWAPPEHRAKVRLLLSYLPNNFGSLDVADPYYSDDAAFTQVLAQVEQACEALLETLQSTSTGDPS